MNMDFERRKKLSICILTNIIRSKIRRRKILSLVLLLLGRSKRRIEEHRNFLAESTITMQRLLVPVLTYFSARDVSERRFWALPRPQGWFQTMLERRDLDSEWPKHFRVSRTTFMRIVEVVRPFMTTQDNRWRPAIPVEKKVAAALWRLATGNAFRCIGVALGMGTSCVQLYTTQFRDVMYDLRTEFISFPSNLTSVIHEFSKKTKIPNVVGAIDGSHIPIKMPGVDQESFANRKQRHSILLQGVVGPNLLFFMRLLAYREAYTIQGFCDLVHLESKWNRKPFYKALNSSSRAASRSNPSFSEIRRTKFDLGLCRHTLA